MVRFTRYLVGQVGVSQPMHDSKDVYKIVLLGTSFLDCFFLRDLLNYSWRININFRFLHLDFTIQ